MKTNPYIHWLIGYLIMSPIIITINNITVDKYISITQSTLKFNKFSISQFVINLSFETWSKVFIGDSATTVFNNFLNTYLRVFSCSFLLQKIYKTHNNKPWTTTGLNTSCQHKRELYLNSRGCSNPKLKVHYKSI